MAEKRDLGVLSHISAEAIGQPGQRRFRLRAFTAGGDTASLWLEKEQLSALGDAIETVLEAEGYQYQRPPLDDQERDPVFPLSASFELRLGQLSMGVNRDTQRLVLIVAEAAGGDDEAETITFEFDFRKGYELRGEIVTVAAAGRPPCPLCSGPLDPEGHVCPRSNGHHSR